MLLHGENIKVYNYGIAIALAKSCTIETSADINEISSATNVSAKNYLSGRTDWKVSVSMFVENMQKDIIMAGREYIITIHVKGNDLLIGKAICSEVNTEFSVGKLAQGFCTFIGNGALQ